MAIVGPTFGHYPRMPGEAVAVLAGFPVADSITAQGGLEPFGDKGLMARCAGFRRAGAVDSTTASAKHTLRALARRWLALREEIAEHDQLLDELTAQVAPTLRDGFGIGPDVAAEMLIIFGDDPRTDPLRGGVREALRRLPHPGVLGYDHGTAPPLPGWPPTGELGALPSRHRADAVS